MKLSFWLFLIFLSFHKLTQAESTLVFGIAGETNKATYALAQKLVGAISERMQVTISLLPLPAKRSTVMLGEGEIHADIARVLSYQRLVPNAIRVEEPIIRLPYHVYTSRQDVVVDGWESLRPYKVVTVSGYEFVDRYMKGFDTYPVGSIEAALKFVKLGRADVFVAASAAIGVSLDKVIAGTKVKRLEPPVDYLNLYTYFSKDSAGYAEAYGRILKQLKNEGAFNSIR